METGGAILKQFHTAIANRDLARARSYLADDMEYQGVFKTFATADTYMTVFQYFMEFTTRLDAKMILSEGDNAAIFYEMETTKPAPAPVRSPLPVR